MALKLMYITNNANIAKIAEDSGVDWIFVDLEINGKEKRQHNLDTVVSRHNIEDVKKIKRVLRKAELLVRVNPLFEGSKMEIDRVIDYGANIVMLPFFTTRYEVEEFIKIVDKRAKVCLLLETPQAVENIDSILSISDIDYIHIGLNDLHIGYGMDFMFELLSDGTIEILCKKIKSKKLKYGFGGIAQLGEGDLPAEYIINEHYRLGSSMVILSRSFCDVNKVDNIYKVEELFNVEVNAIRDYESSIILKSNDFFKNNQSLIKDKIKVIKYKKAVSNEQVIDNGSV